MMLAFVFAEGGIQLVPDGTLFFHIALILLMLFVLNRVLFRPINAILDKREASQGGRSAEAQAMLQKVDESMMRYQSSLQAARAESYAVMEAERAEAVRLRQEKLSVMRDEIKAAVEAERASIEAQAAQARATLDADAKRIAAEIGSRILHRSVAA